MSNTKLPKTSFTWSKPIDGVINVPDELDPLINSMLNQYGFCHHSNLFGPQEMVCRMAELAQRFFSSSPQDGMEDEETKELEESTTRNMDVISLFIDHLKSEGIEISEKHFLSFFNA